VTRATLHLTFPEHLISEPVIQGINTEFGLVTNIHRANLKVGGIWRYLFRAINRLPLATAEQRGPT